MNTETTEILCGINNDFYRNHCASFSATRTAPWSGWHVCLDLVQEMEADAHTPLAVFDLACGNLRFESFLQAELPLLSLTYYAVDNCDALVSTMPHMYYQSLDILQTLQHGTRINDMLSAPPCNLSVCFGFMHHVPLREFRENILLSLIEQTRSGGYVVVSFWQFLNNETLKNKAQSTHERALKELSLEELDENDYILGWKNIPGAYRYCHSFSETEIDQLVAGVAGKAVLSSRFKSDGRTNDLNTYLVLKVN